MAMIRIVEILVLFLLIIGITYAEDLKNQSELTVIGENYPPFSFLADGKVTGSSVDLIEEISADAGIPVNRSDISLYPWAEVYNMTVNGSSTLLLAVYRTPDRESDLQWVGPVANDSSAVFVGSEAGISITTTDSLKTLKVGVVSGDAHYGMLTGYGVSENNIITAENVSSLIPMVQNGSIDALFYGEQAGKSAIKEVTGEEGTLPVAYRVDEQEVWFGLSPDTPVEIIEKLQASLDKKQTAIK